MADDSPPDHSDDATVRRTSDWVAAVRAAEYSQPDRFVDDPYAGLLADEEAVATVARLQELGAPVELAIIRGRLGDEALRRALAAGIDQAVCLGAGSDTRAWRAGLPAQFHYFEVDLPGQSAAKARLLDAAAARPTCHWHPVEADLRGGWSQPLLAAGLRTDRPVHWFAEGVVPYLSVPAAEELFRTVSELSAPGSTVVCDLLESAAFTHPPYRPFLDEFAALGLVIIPHDELDRWLVAAGWQARVYRVADLAAGTHPLVRQPLPKRLNVEQAGLGYLFATRLVGRGGG
jgi:methyltransferase (TIGR00027 family)